MADGKPIPSALNTRVCIFGLFLLAGCQETEETNPKAESAEIVAKLEEIVSLREKQVESEQLKLELGKLAAQKMAREKPGQTPGNGVGTRGLHQSYEDSQVNGDSQ